MADDKRFSDAEEEGTEGADGAENSDRFEGRVRGLLGDTVKKLFTAGVGAAFMTEESIRKYLSELRLPKDVLAPILQGAAKSKEELMNVVTNEVVNVIKKIDVVKEASRFVEEHKFRVSAEIEVVRRDAGKADVKESGQAESQINVNIQKS